MKQASDNLLKYEYVSFPSYSEHFLETQNCFQPYILGLSDAVTPKWELSLIEHRMIYST